jgi:hypothetical protein
VAALVAALLGVLLSACSSGSSTLQTYTVGPAGHQMRIAATESQHVDASPLSKKPVAGSALLAGSVGYTGRLALPDNGSLQWSVAASPTTVPAAHARWIINDFFNNTPERRGTWHGMPADLGVRPCSTPSGPCPGYLGGIQVLSGNTLYSVFVSADDRATIWNAIHSFGITGT